MMNENYPDMTALEAAQLRASKAIDPKVATKPVEVRSYTDIQKLVAEFAPGAQKEMPPVQVHTVLVGEDETGSIKKFNVSATSNTKSKRAILLDGFNVIKRYQELIQTSQERAIAIEVNGVQMSPPDLVVQDPSSWVDPLVVRWFGGRRKGLRVSWMLGEYEYLYDPYQHKLSRRLVGSNNVTGD